MKTRQIFPLSPGDPNDRKSKSGVYESEESFLTPNIYLVIGLLAKLAHLYAGFSYIFDHSLRRVKDRTSKRVVFQTVRRFSFLKSPDSSESLLLFILDCYLVEPIELRP